MHLEVVNSMDTDEFIMCLRRFINRRGDVKELRCDNGSNFVGSERELKKTDVVLRTLFTERERILKGRTLTANSDDPNDRELRPSVCLLESLRRQTLTERSGRRFNFWPIFFGKGG